MRMGLKARSSHRLVSYEQVGREGGGGGFNFEVVSAYVLLRAPSMIRWPCVITEQFVNALCALYWHFHTRVSNAVDAFSCSGAALKPCVNGYEGLTAHQMKDLNISYILVGH